jgi:hypothetical protein
MRKMITVECTVYVEMYVDTDKTDEEIFEILSNEASNADDIYYDLIDNGIDVYDSNLENLSFSEFYYPNDNYIDDIE